MSELHHYPRGAAEIDRLIAALQDPVLEVRATAYQLLQSVDSAKAKAAIAGGVLLNPGDRCYSVYKSAIHFDDEWFHLDRDIYLNFFDEIDWEDLGYADYEAFCTSENDSYSGGEIESYIPKRVACYLSKPEAEATAEQLHQKLVSEWDYTGCFEERSDFVFHAWCKAHQIQYVGGYGYWHDLSDELKAAGNYTLLGKLWRDSVGEFAFVREEIVSEPQYFMI